MDFSQGNQAVGYTTPEQQGNVGAQQALLSGLPQMNNAILGRQVDYNAMQPQQFDYNMDFSQGNQAVGYTTPEQQSHNVQMATATQPQRLSSLLSGDPNQFGGGGMRNPFKFNQRYLP
jgi:hypothetical protein